MKTLSVVVLKILVLLVGSVVALQLLQVLFEGSGRQPSPVVDHQVPVMVPALPHTRKDNPASGTDGPVILSDVIGKERSINIFAGLTREVDGVAARCEDDAQNTTVLAPRNSVLTAMPRKPWEDADDYTALGEKAYDGSDGRDRAQMNLRRFVEAHVVPVSPWREGEEVQALNGAGLRWEMKDGKRMIQPGNIEVVSIANEVANGEIWILDDILVRS